MNTKPLKEKDLTPNRYTPPEVQMWTEKPRHNGTRRTYTATTGGLDASAWLQALREKRASENTLRVYAAAIADLSGFLEKRGRTRPVDVTEDDLATWRLSMIERELAATTVHMHLSAARKWFAWLEARGEVFTSPAASLVLSRPHARLKPALSQADMKTLLGSLNPARPCGVRDRAFWETGYATGARREELQKLDVHDVNLDAGTLRVVGKGRKERVVPLTKQAVKWLARYTQEARPTLLKGELNEPALWVDSEGKRLTLGGIGAVCRNAAKAVGMTVSPHALRRACATHLLQNGAHPFYVKELLGHATLGSLANYLRLTIADLKAMHAKSKPGR